MRAGKLRNRGTLQRITDYSAFNTEGSWTDYAVAWAGIESVVGRDFVEGRKYNAETTHILEMRYMPGVRPGMRWLFEGRVFKIIAALNVDEMNRELQIQAAEETA